MQHQTPARTRRVDALAKRHEADTDRVKLVEQQNQVTQIPAEPIEPPADQDIEPSAPGVGLPGAEHCRGYIQHWNQCRGAEPIPERSAQRIFKAADQILKAGTTDATVLP